MKSDKLIVDLYEAPKDWVHILKTLGITWKYAEQQLIADQFLLAGCYIPNVIVPKWVRDGS